jgi:antitoxin FitA
VFRQVAILCRRGLCQLPVDTLNTALAHIGASIFAREKEIVLSRRTDSRYAIIAINAIIDCMASITIRKLPETTKRRLRLRAARNGRSMEQEARELLETGLAKAEAPSQDLGESIHKIFAPFGGVNLEIPKREPIPESRIRKLFR